MKKQELIHYHALLAELRTYIEAKTGENINMPAYDELNVNPVAIHVGKGQHEDAVFSLAEGLAEAGFSAPEPKAYATHAAPADD